MGSCVNCVVQIGQLLVFHTVQARKSRLLLCLESGVGVITEALWAPERLIPIGPAEQGLPGGDVLDSRRERMQDQGLNQQECGAAAKTGIGCRLI